MMASEHNLEREQVSWSFCNSVHIVQFCLDCPLLVNYTSDQTGSPVIALFALNTCTCPPTRIFNKDGLFTKPVEPFERAIWKYEEHFVFIPSVLDILAFWFIILGVIFRLYSLNLQTVDFSCEQTKIEKCKGKSASEFVEGHSKLTETPKKPLVIFENYPYGQH